MERREVLALVGLSALATTIGGRMADAQSRERNTRARLVRVYADSNDISHLEELPMADKLAPVPVVAVEILNYTRDSTAWHPAPDTRFALNIVGDLDVVTSDGKHHHLGPADLVALEDLAGKGHQTHRLSPVVTMFFHLAKGFDFEAWAAGKEQAIAPPAKPAPPASPAVEAGDDTIHARLLRLYTDTDGESRLEELVMRGSNKSIPATEIRLGNAKPGDSSGKFHNAFFRRFVRNIVGEMDITTSDGKTHRIGPTDLVFLEDVEGKGHVSTPLTPLTAIFIHVEDGFDVVSWAANPGN